MSCSRVLGGLHSAACSAQTRLCRAFSASKAFVWRVGSLHPLHRRGCGVGLPRESPNRLQLQQQQQQQRCCQKGHRKHALLPSEDSTRGWQADRMCHADSLSAVAVKSASELLQGVIVCVCEVVGDAVGFEKKKMIEQFDPSTPSKKSTVSMECAGQIARSKKLGTLSTAYLTTADSVPLRKSPSSIDRSDCTIIRLIYLCTLLVRHCVVLP